jgi:3-dehydroquinate dehydratase / shikimate dehydrogenase
MSLEVGKICTIVGRTRHKMVIVELQEAVKRGADFVEMRIDFLAKAIDFQRLVPFKKCPWIATLRRREDGGRWVGTEPERRMLIRQAIVSGHFEWVDLETDVADEIPRFGKVKRIVSYHNLTSTPPNLEEIYERMCQQDADVVKMAVTAQTASDNVRLLNILKMQKKPTIGHCMGEIGFPSRILAVKYGAPFVYAAFNKERGIAPGLPSLEEVKRVYNIDRINADTEVYGVIGDPVSHSYSPLLHNQFYKSRNVNAVYLPFRVPRGELPSMLEAFEAIPVNGYSVTIPHKETAAILAAVKDARVIETQAANTLVRTEGGFSASNTDYDAIIGSLNSVIPTNDEGQKRAWQGCTALVLGAGGAARAVVHALKQMHISVTIASRTLDRAENLAQEIDGTAVDWHARHGVNCDLLINCTPIGMHPNVDESPIIGGYFRPGMVVFDTVYNPETTMLIKDARNRGCQCITGVEMFIRQAALQIELFTNQVADLEVMREIMRRALSPVTGALDEPMEQKPLLEKMKE